MIEFLRENWAIIALVCSELLAFVPVKFKGIAQLILKIGASIFGKKTK